MLFGGSYAGNSPIELGTIVAFVICSVLVLVGGTLIIGLCALISTWVFGSASWLFGIFALGFIGLAHYREILGLTKRFLLKD